MPSFLPSFLSANKRSEQQYNKIILALRHATKEITNVNAGLDDLLTRLLPHLVATLEAEVGLIYHRLISEPGTNQFELLSATIDEVATVIEAPKLQALTNAPDAQILDNSQVGLLREVTRTVLNDAIIGPLRLVNRHYLVIVGNKQTTQYPFLAADRTILNFLLAIMAAQLGAEEQLLREHEAVQQIGELVAKGNTDELWSLIAQSAARLSNTKYARIYSFEGDRNRLVPQCNWNAERQGPSAHHDELNINQKSLNTFVATQREPAYIDNLDTTTIPFLKEKFENDVQSAYCIPLISQGTLVGTLYVAATMPDSITIEDRKTIDRLAPHAAVALNTARLIKQTQRNLEIDEIIIAMQQHLADVLQETYQVEQIYTVLEPFFPRELNLFLGLWDVKQEKIRLPIVLEHGERKKSGTHSLYAPRQKGERRGLIDYMVEHNQEQLDVPDFSNWADTPQIEQNFQNGLRCCLVVALKHGKHLVGWLGFRGYDSAYMFDDRQRELLKRMAPHIATVLYNSSQYDQKIKERQVVSEFQTTVSELTETEAAEVAQISQAVRDALNKLGTITSDMYIALVDSVKQMIHIPVVYIKGHELSAEEKANDRMYRTRPLYERNGFTEHILRTNEPILVHNRKELEEWHERGLDVIPSHFRCWVGVPMRVLGQTIGVMALRSAVADDLFDQNHVDLLQTIANQAAITLQNARQYEEVRKTSRYNEALYQASRAISRAGVKEEQVLQTIVAQAVQKTGSHLGVIYRRESNYLKLQTIYPPELAVQFSDMIGPNDGTVINLALSANEAQLVPDVSINSDYVDILNGKTKSQIAVVLRAGAEKQGEPLGVISIEHPDINGLTERERLFVIALADLAAVAMQNAERARALQRNTVVAVMGAWGAEVMHNINRHVGDIRTAIYYILQLEQMLSDESSDLLNSIDQKAASMLLPEFYRGKPVVTLNNYQDTAVLDEALRSEINHFRQETNQAGNSPNISFQPGCPAVTVRIHERWLRILVRHYLSNATRHLSQITLMPIVIRTTIGNNQAVVYVENHGNGITEELCDLLFEEPVAPTEQTSGRGLLLVRFICEYYQGRAWLDSKSTDTITRFAFSVPVANPERKDNDNDNKNTHLVD